MKFMFMARFCCCLFFCAVSFHVLQAYGNDTRTNDVVFEQSRETAKLQPKSQAFNCFRKSRYINTFFQALHMLLPGKIISLVLGSASNERGELIAFRNRFGLAAAVADVYLRRANGLGWGLQPANCAHSTRRLAQFFSPRFLSHLINISNERQQKEAEKGFWVSVL